MAPLFPYFSPHSLQARAHPGPGVGEWRTMPYYLTVFVPPKETNTLFLSPLSLPRRFLQIRT